MVRPVQAPSQILLDWFDHHQRQFPWRAIPGQIMDPYRVWLSEIMLQQTTTITVRGYFEDFVSRWPSIEDLAAAELDAVLHAWQGLGYYARARNLHKCAKLITKEYGGKFPETEAALIRLPGIGPYTAAAISAIALPAESTAGTDRQVQQKADHRYARQGREPPACAASRLDLRFAN